MGYQLTRNESRLILLKACIYIYAHSIYFIYMCKSRKRSSYFASKFLVPVMSTEKRKAPDEWLKPTFLNVDETTRGVYLARFSGVVPPDSTTFREYKRKRTGDRSLKDVILQGETERIEYEGRTRGDNVDESCQYDYCSFCELS